MKGRLLLTAALLLATSGHAATVAGVRLEPTMRVAGQTLELVSCGVRDTFWIDHYAAGLYLPPGADPQAVQHDQRPKAVRLKVIQARYLPQNVPDKWRGALKQELAREPMARVRAAYDRLSDGDEVTFSYMPKQGVTMSVNGRKLLTTPGHAVIDAILEAWAEEDPISGKLQRLALEHPC